MADSKGINFSDLYKLASGAIDAASLELHQLSDAIWQKPELGFSEVEAHKNITDFLEKKGFPVERKYILDTAFRYGGFLSSKPYHYII